MSVIVDQETCIGCGVCESVYPDLFEMGDDSKARVKPLSGFDVNLAKEAASQCPVNAIAVS